MEQGDEDVLSLFVATVESPDHNKGHTKHGVKR